MQAYVIGEIVKVRINDRWYDAEILDVAQSGVYVYVFDLRAKHNVSNTNIKR